MQCCQALLLCYTLAAAGSLVFADTNGTVNCVPFCLLYTSRFLTFLPNIKTYHSAYRSAVASKRTTWRLRLHTSGLSG